MKKSSFLFLAFALVSVFSCSRDALEVLPGAWSTSDGGTITFNANGTGTASGSEWIDSHYNFCETSSFTWELATADAVNDTNLGMDFEDTEFCISGQGEFPMKVNGNNKITLGVKGAIIYEDYVELTRQ